MNDESPPPPLRLKPRVAQSPAPAEPVSLSDGAETAGSEAELPRLRLKPRLDAAGDAAPLAAPAPAEAVPEPAVSLRPRLKPKLDAAVDAAPSAVAQAAPPSTDPRSPALGEPAPAEAAKPSPAPVVALKPKLRPLSEPAVEPSAAPPPQVAAAFPPPFPPPVPPQAEKPPSVASSASAPPAPEAPPPPQRSRPENKPAFRLGLVLVSVLAIGFVGAGGFLAYTWFMAPAEPTTTPPSKAASRTPPAQPAVAEPAPAPAPTEESESPEARVATSGYGQALEKARAVIGAREQSSGQQMAEVLGEEPILPVTTEPAAPSRSAATSSIARTAATVPTTSAPPPSETAIPPSPEFQAWVTEARFTGVRGGSAPRAVINGRLVVKGDLVNEALGITFEGVDPNQNILYFRDPSGAVVGRRF